MAYRSSLFIGAMWLALLAVPQHAGAEWIRLAWDPNPEREVVGYRVHVGTRPGVYAETFEVLSRQTTFVYTRALADTRYYFAVAAVAAGGAVSPLSEEVSGFGRRVGKGLPPPARSPDGEAGSGSQIASACAGGAAFPCAATAPVADDLGSVTALVSAGRDRAFFIEDERLVRQVADGALYPQAALEAESGERLTGLAADPDFDRTRFVYVAAVVPRRGGPELRIVRYRELAGRLGEGAAIVSIALSEPGGAPFAVDAERRIYVAMPAEPAGRRDPYAGQVLRFSEDGRAQGATGSPVLTRGMERPGRLAFDAGRGELWLLGEEGGTRQLRRLSVRGGGGAQVPTPRPARAVAVSSLPPARSPSGLVAIADGDGRVFVADISADGGALGAWRDVPLGGTPAFPVEVAASGARLYVAVRTAAPAVAPSALVQISIP